ncbi:MAG: metal ABC transporter permease [Deltaproteobacteria bacterium]|jgi:manganese/iron transport system permease protein/iron/zinc/copper transport system permease protein|nr:metal ABC transporter permease [Deltaproteobacteria bacterium]
MISAFDPLQYEFFRHGLLAAILVGALCGFVGVYVVLRRMSYIGHGLAHAIFGGAVLSLAININFFIGAGIWALMAASLVHLIAHRRLVGADAAIGVVTTSSFAIGVAIVSTYRRFTRNIEAALFGNILGITQSDLWIITSIALLVFLGIIIIRRQLLFSTFDPEVASAYGISTGWTDFVFILLLAITVLASTQILGVTLVAAAIVIPPVIARYLTRSFHTLLIVSPIIGALCGAVGMFLSYYLDISSAAMIVLTATALFLVVEVGLTLRKALTA